MRLLVAATLLAACAAAPREVVATMKANTCDPSAASDLEPMAVYLAAVVWDLGTQRGGTTFGTDLRGDDDQACPVDIHHRIFVGPGPDGLFVGTVKSGPIDRCTGTPLCAVVFEVSGVR